MKIKLKRVLISTVTSIYLLSFSGCLDDRAFLGTRTNIAETGIDTEIDSDGDGLSDKQEEKLGTNPNNSDSDGDGLNDKEEIDLDTDPNNPDTDGDGLDDGKEVHDTKTDPLKADSDGDGLSDKEEIDLGTNPNSKDSDNDGVEDGIEVGFDGEGENKVYHVNNPANTNHDDDPDLIDALDPLNDSDGDKRPNLYEIDSQKRKDAGYLVDFNETTDPLDESDYYPWITEVEPGKTMIDNGFVYIPGGFDVDGDGDDESGFWMAQYEARAGTGIVTPDISNFSEYINDNFTIINAINMSGYIEGIPGSSLGGSFSTAQFKDIITSPLPMTGMYAFEASVILEQSQIDETNSSIPKISLPSIKQYVQVQKLIKSDTVKNNLLGVDYNVAEDYTVKVYEIGVGAKEFTNSTVKLQGFSIPAWWNMNGSIPVGATAGIDVFKNNDFSGIGFGIDQYAVIVSHGEKIDLRYSVAYGQASGGAEIPIGFRAASDYLK